MQTLKKIFRDASHEVPTRKQIWFAFAVALVTDALQFSLGPFGWILIDEGLDVLAMVLISWAIGFHMLLLPTCIIKFIPGPDMLPTWTGCTAAVIILRKKAQPKSPVDIPSEVTPVPPLLISDVAAPPASKSQPLKHQQQYLEKFQKKA